MEVVRVAVAEDLAALLRLERACAEAPHWSGATWSLLLSASGDLRCVMVAASEAEIAGFIVVGSVGKLAELESVAVDVAHRSRGVGRMLCHAAMQWAAERGAKTMELEVRAGSAVARTLYASLGFREEGLRSRYYSDPAEDAVLMRAVLT